MKMVEQESWENKCCRCGDDIKVDLHPGRRACHVTCGPCMYPDDWGKCASCEIVGHCAYALDHLKSMKLDGLKKGCFFEQQLTGEETLYHILNFVNGQQNLADTVGEKAYLANLKKTNVRSSCLQK